MRKIPKIRVLVIKIGSSILTGEDMGINAARISEIVFRVSELKKSIPNILIVSSGAIAAGFRVLGFKSRPKEIVDKQACAAVGQARLVWTYEQEFEKYGIPVAQILLTKDDLSNRKRYLHAKSALDRLLSLGVVPIINENDTITADELKYVESFGDNDNLGALVACLAGADMLMIMSDVDGLYTGDPSKDKNAVLIREVGNLDDNIKKLAGDSFSGIGTGGMSSKLAAAGKSLEAGCQVAIIKGLEPENITRFFNGEDVGTFFPLSGEVIAKRKFWIGYAAIPKGKVFVDKGAEAALLKNKSLLPKGICAVEGNFSSGDVIGIFSHEGREIARGKIRYCAADTSKIKGKKSSEIAALLGNKISDEAVHADDMLLL